MPSRLVRALRSAPFHTRPTGAPCRRSGRPAPIASLSFIRQLCLAVLAQILLPPSAALAADSPRLRCQFDTSGERRELDFAPTAEPYLVPAIPVGRHFRFKAVVTARDGQIEWISLYTYYPDGDRTVLLHTARHAAPPITDGRNPFALTGEQRVYSPILERELVFGCALVADRP